MRASTGDRPYWRCYYANTDAVIYVVDSADRDRIGISKTELVRMLEEEELRNAILLVFANKQDIEGSMTPAEVSEALGLPLLKSRTWQIFRTSAVKGDGLAEAMDWCVAAAVRGVRATAQQRRPLMRPHRVDRLTVQLKGRR